MKKASSFRWYGFDLDGTIADNTDHGFGMLPIGKPIKPMCNLMKRLHREGKRVKIVTARLNDVGIEALSQREVRNHIWDWCDRNLGFRPEITDTKDGMMERLYDDRACQVICNKGITYEDVNAELAACLKEALMKIPLMDMNDKFMKRCQSVLAKC